MRRQLDVMGKTITRSAWSGARWPSAGPEMSEWHARLMAADMEGELVHQILDSAERRAAREPGGLEAAVEAEIAQRVLVDGAMAAGGRAAGSGAGRPPGRGQDDHAGQAGGNLRLGRAPAHGPGVDGRFPRGGRRPVALLRGHPGHRFSGARQRGRVGPGAR